MEIHRQIIKPIDIQVAFGKSKSTSAKMIRTVKNSLGKEKHQLLTINDFCDYYGLDKAPLIEIIINNDNLKKNAKSKLENDKSDETVKPIVSESKTVTAQNQTAYQFSKKSW